MKKKASNSITKQYEDKFDLSSLTWGYRDLFQKHIDDLYENGFLGDNNKEVTEDFFSLLNYKSKVRFFDGVLIEFLKSLHTKNRWILKNKNLFREWIRLAKKFAIHKHYLADKYFSFWKDGCFGDTPESVDYVIRKADQLIETGYYFSISFIMAYKELSQLMTNSEIDIFANYAKTIHHNSKDDKYSQFLLLQTQTSKIYVNNIKKEIRLIDVKERLTHYASAISGEEIEIDDFTVLDSDEIIERGSTVISIQKWLYFPAKVSHFQKNETNFNYYLLATLTASAALFYKSFNTVLGEPGIKTSLKFIEKKEYKYPQLVNNLFLICETYRILNKIKNIFQGIEDVLKQNIIEEIKHLDITSATDLLLITILEDLLNEKTNESLELQKLLNIVKKVALNATSYEETIDNIQTEMNNDNMLDLIKKYCFADCPPLAFFPDFMYPSTIATEEKGDKATSDSSTNNEDEDDDENSLATSDNEKSEMSSDGDGKESEEGKEKQKENNKEKDIIEVGYTYDEWSCFDNDYFENWCFLREKTDLIQKDYLLNPAVFKISKEVKKIFEQIKPDEIQKEKYLLNGDYINIERFVEFYSSLKLKQPAEERFYEKNHINKRELSVAVLIDVSGSTCKTIEYKKTIIDVEKEAAFILAEGLSEIGDNFGLFGFSGTGRQGSEYYIYKDFSDDWNDETQKKLMSAKSKTSTRIGVALRHTANKLSKENTKKKLIILITDGKPSDSFYESSNRYAQYDIRQANEENHKQGIDAFCISTEENSIEDLEIMFPNHRFVIINNMLELPKILSQLYLKITT